MTCECAQGRVNEIRIKTWQRQYEASFHFLKRCWSRVDLQCCDHFCCTTKGFGYACTHIHSFSGFFPIWIITDSWVEQSPVGYWRVLIRVQVSVQPVLVAVSKDIKEVNGFQSSFYFWAWISSYCLPFFLGVWVGWRMRSRAKTMWRHIWTKLNLAYILIHLCGCSSSEKAESKCSPGKTAAMMKARHVLEPTRTIKPLNCSFPNH